MVPYRLFLNNRHRFLPVAMFLSCLWTGSALAQPVLSLSDAVSLALQNSPEGDIATIQREQARLTTQEARAARLPQLTLQGQGGRDYNDPFSGSNGTTGGDGYSNGYSTTASLQQKLFDGASTRSLVAQRRQLEKSATLSLEKIREEIIASVVRSYLDICQFQSIEMAAADNIAMIREAGRITDARIAGGDASQAEKNYIDARIAAGEQAKLNARNARKDAITLLQALLGGQKVGQTVWPLPSLFQAQQLMMADETVLLEQGSRSNLDIRILESDRQAALYEWKSEKGRFFPTIDAVLEGSHGENTSGDTGLDRGASARVQMTYKLFDGGARRAVADRALSKVNETTIKRDRALRDTRQKLEQQFNALRSSVEELQIARREFEANRELARLNLQQFREGDASITDLVESQERIFAARQKMSSLAARHLNASVDVLRGQGKLTGLFTTEEPQP
jgi:adhesin transport system outer membrane protein